MIPCSICSHTEVKLIYFRWNAEKCWGPERCRSVTRSSSRVTQSFAISQTSMMIHFISFSQFILFKLNITVILFIAQNDGSTTSLSFDCDIACPSIWNWLTCVRFICTEFGYSVCFVDAVDSCKTTRTSCAVCRIRYWTKEQGNAFFTFPIVRLWKRIEDRFISE